MIEPEIREVYDQTDNQPTISTNQHRPSNPNIEMFNVINCENKNDKHARSHASMHKQKTRAELLNSLSCFNRLAKRGLYPMTIEQVQDTYLELLKIEIRLTTVTSEEELERVDQLYDTTIEMIESNQRRRILDCSETKDGDADQTKSTEKEHVSPVLMVDNFKPEIREEVDGSEMNNGEIEIEKEVEDEDNETVDNHDCDENGDGIEDNLDEESSRLVVNPPMDTTPSHPIGQMVIRQCSTLTKRKQTKEEPTKWTNQEDLEKVTSPPINSPYSQLVNQPRPSHPTTSNSTKQIITHTLQCPQCDEMLTPDKFAKHLNVHSIGPFRCAVKDCRQSFANSRILSDHLAQSHQSTSQWPCDKCDHHYPSYKHLSTHNQQHHQLGHFECSFPACTFTGECKSKVFTHYAAQHRQIIKKMKKCLHPGCQYETAKSNNLKQHQRAHLGIKPYKCKLCIYAATKRSTIIDHIRRRHLKGTPNPRVPLGDFIGVNEMLLDNPVGHDATSRNYKQKQTITHTFQCLQCGLMFAQDHFNDHLKTIHSIGSLRCLVKDCGQSFTNTYNLSHHLAQSHQSTSQWHCDKCDHHFPSYNRLSDHNTQQHQLGHFQCSFLALTSLMEEYKKTKRPIIRQDITNRL